MTYQASRRNSRARRLRFEKLEDRRVLSAVTVSTIADVVDWDQIGGISELISSPGADNKISLREAILAANFDDLADTINFDPALSGTIALTDAQGELFISDSLTINGPGASVLTIDAGNGADSIFNTGDGFRVFEVASLPEAGQVEISGTGSGIYANFALAA